MYLDKLFSLNDEMFNKRLQSFAENNAENINKIILIIRSDKEKLFPNNIDDIDIYCDKFKEICNSVIFIPNIFPDFVSGVSIIYFCNSIDCKYIPNINFDWKKGLLKNYTDEEQKRDKTYYDLLRKEHKQKIFFDNPNSYLEHIEEELKINLHNMSKSRGKPLWKLLDLYGYYTHDFIINNAKPKESSLFDLLSVLIYTRSFDKVPSKYKEKFFFRTVLLMKLTNKDKDIDNVTAIHQNLAKIYVAIMLTVPLLTEYIQTLMIAKQTANYEYSIEYYELFTELEQWLVYCLAEI